MSDEIEKTGEIRAISAQPTPPGRTPCQHEHEVGAVVAGAGVLKRCIKCGDLEME